ncbi:MAG: LamG-like jellyroll fold domain-containing protein, partial [Pseudomonadota bacterium]
MKLSKSHSLVGLAVAAACGVWVVGGNDDTQETALAVEAAQSLQPIQPTERPVARVIDTPAIATRVQVEQQSFPAGTEYDDDGLPLFVPAAPAVPGQTAPTEARRPAALAVSSAPVGLPAAGEADHVIALTGALTIDALREKLAELDGEVVRHMPRLSMATIRLPEGAESALDAIDGIGTVAANTEVQLMSTMAKATVQLPSPGSPQYTEVNTDIGVAVIDSGVADHEDLNIARHVHLTAPATLSNTNKRHDHDLVGMYLFDENGPVVYDRAGSDREHLYFDDAGTGILAPDAVDWASLPSFEMDDFESFVFNNRTSETLTLSYIEINNGSPNGFVDTVVPAGQSAYAWGFEGESWFVSSQDGSHQAVLLDPVDAEFVDYKGAPIQWNEGTARINHGQLVSVAESQTSAACTNKDEAAIELFFTPGDETSFAEIAARRGNGRDHFVLRQQGNRLQAVIGIENGAIYTYSNGGSVKTGQAMHVVVSRDKNGHVRLFVNGVQQGYSGINRSTPLVWEGAGVTTLGDAQSGWTGEFDAFAVHCGNLWRSKAQANF